jgi:hypothetical protein
MDKISELEEENEFLREENKHLKESFYLLKSQKDGALVETNLSTSFDPMKESVNHLMGIVFAKSRSSTYPLAVNVAQGAYRYAETIIDKQTIHTVLFSMTKDDISKALALIDYLSGSKSLSIFVRGRICNNYYPIMEVLRCYTGATNCTDYRAYCCQVIDDPFLERHTGGMSFTIRLALNPDEVQKPTIVQKYLFPCKHLHSYFQFQKGHPSTIEDQIQAAGIEKSCDWCPNFQPSGFKKLPSKIIYPDGTVMVEPSLEE